MPLRKGKTITPIKKTPKPALQNPPDLIQPWFEYLNISTGRTQHLSDEGAVKWAQELRNLPYTHPDLKTLAMYCHFKEITTEGFKKICARFPVIQEAFNHFMELTGDKLWVDAVQNKANMNALRMRYWRFGEQFREDIAREIAEKTQQAEHKENRIEIVVKNGSDIVTPKE